MNTMAVPVELLKLFKIAIFAWLLGLMPMTFADNCTKLLHGLAARQQDYVRCSTDHAVPVTLCKGCQNFFENMVHAFDGIKNDENCSRKFFDHDRINVVQTTQNMLIDLWNKAHCDDCFHNNNSDTFSQKLTVLQSCLNLNKRIECLACVTEYEDLNNFYIFLDQHNNGKVCYDLQDAMNQTRVHWSKDLKCCKREFHMTLFVVATICVGILPLMFYAGAYAITKYRERNHSVLNMNEDFEEERRGNPRTTIEETQTNNENSAARNVQ